MPGAIHNYWLGIMALSFALAVVLWIGLVFWAERHPVSRARESWPHREVMGGSFAAREGGRQVMPNPSQEPEPEPAPEAQAPVRPPAPDTQAPVRPPAPREPAEPSPVER